MSSRVKPRDLANRNRRVQSEQRKQQIIDATITCIETSGLSQLTLDKIATEAGITKGNLVFHFENRDNLLEQTLKSLNDEYLQSWQSALAAAGAAPLAQVQALIDVRFTAQLCSRKKIGIWYAFWGETRSRPRYLAVCGQSDRAYSDALLRCCENLHAELGGTLQPATAALAIEGMIDGLWQDMLISPNSMTRREAVAAVHRLLSALFPCAPEQYAPKC